MSTDGLWSRTRQNALAEITTVAMDLLLTKGFEATTFDDIAAAAGISRRSLFRYFGTKEDIVLGHLADEGPRARQALAERPGDEPVWLSLREILMRIDAPEEVDHERLLKISRMMYGTPSLRARSVEKHLRWQEDLLPEVRKRMKTGPHADVRAAAVIAGAIACLDAAGEAWTRQDGATPLHDLIEAAFDAVGPA